MSTLTHKSAAAALVALMMGAGVAHATSALPPIHRSGPVEYLSGGIGLSESTAIERASKQWPLALEFAVKDGEHADFAAGVKVLVRNDDGHAALKTTSQGPFLLARLAPGRYTVDATLAGKTLHEQAVVRKGESTKTLFVWPAGTGQGRS